MCCIWALLGFSAFCGTALAVDSPLLGVQYSTNVSVSFAGSFGHDHDYFIGTHAAPTRMVIPGIPATANLDGLHLENDLSVLFSLDVPVRTNGLYAQPGDVLKRSGNDVSLALDASALGVPGTVNCDAVARLPDGSLLVSFSREFRIGNAAIRPADVVRHDGSNWIKVLDAAAAGLSRRLDVDALSAESATLLLVSFDSGGQVGNVRFADEDILAYDSASNTWTMRVDLSAISSQWGRVDLDALSTTAGADTLFRNQFE